MVSVAEHMVDSLDPLVVDLSLDLGLSAEEMVNMERDVFLKAFESAIQGMIASNPSLADVMPELPTNLEALID